MGFLPCKRTEDEGNDRAPAGDAGRDERGEIKQVHEAHPRHPRTDKEDHEEAKREIVDALQADDLRHDEPRIPHDRPIEHVFLSPSRKPNFLISSRDLPNYPTRIQEFGRGRERKETNRPKTA